MVGLIGGTFHPIHNGHIHLALMLKEMHGLEEVWFIPALQNPFKQECSLSFEHRSKMVELAISDIPDFKMVPIESELPSPSYTINTVQALQLRYPNKKFYLLLGSDHLSSLDQWKRVKELFEICPPLIGARSPAALPNSEIKNLINNGITEIPLLDISSTWLKNRLEQNQYCAHLIDPRVLDYIKQNGLYYLPYDRI